MLIDFFMCGYKNVYILSVSSVFVQDTSSSTSFSSISVVRGTAAILLDISSISSLGSAGKIIEYVIHGISTTRDELVPMEREHK